MSIEPKMINQDSYQTGEATFANAVTCNGTLTTTGVNTHSGTNTFSGTVRLTGTVAMAGRLGGATITVGTEAATVINVGIQLNDEAGTAMAERASLMAYVSDDANGDSVAATAPDTVAIGTDGLAIPLVANKCFLLTSEADGDIDVNFTNAAADTFYLILVMPDGSLVASGAITHAGA